MTEVIPFRGLLCDPERVAMEGVIAPPYDVITPARVECGKEFAYDTDSD
ncbi:hypothetical protein MBAV_004676 [Candidatus Magnetobacterium bavaricum]|uniref:Uncharacterized protein n=1 Tax=Candidatus Magnetobacterium bavaricum TaxID=29290 RepID=A0A0F3GMI4_9BACT|nr:hypothetical protein MBAV_004676 [Candidatus Magnetobacterium bavaricum]